MLKITPTDDNLYEALEAFLQQLLPAGDAIFTGSVVNGTLTVSEMVEGTILIGDQLLGDHVAANTFIQSFVADSGEPGGAGQYLLSIDQGTVGVPSCTMSTFCEIIQAQLNRVPEPRVSNFVVMNILRLPRLSTNFEAYADVTFTGEIAGTVLTISSETHGAIASGSPVFGEGVTLGTTVRAPGAVSGTWIISPEQTVASRAMAAGLKTMTQASQATVQLDVHGPNSSNFAMIISTVFRSESATAAFELLNPAIAPLYADDPRQMPFHGGEQQYETRYIIEANFQVNQTVSIGQQFADQLEVTTFSAEVQQTPIPGDDLSLDFSDPDNSQYIPGL
jgi:hypothetical protein